MVSVLSRLRNPFKYTQLAQSPDTTTSRLHIPTFRFFNSKRHVILAAAALLVLFSLGAPFLTAPNTGRSHASGSQGWSFGPRPQTTVDAVDWSRFAYTQYATNAPYLCNSVMLFEILHRLGSRAERLLMYPSNFEISRAGTDDESKESLLLRKARDEYNVRLKPIEVVARNSDDPTWAESYTKLLAFNQTQYDRVLSLDSDSTVLQTMDELFLLPPVPLALPRAYWLNFDDRVMSSQVLLIQPSKFEYKRVAQATSTAGSNDYDMEIVNNLYKDNAMILPHRPYNLLTGEFRNQGSHKDYMGSDEEPFDPEKALKEAKYLHFSDWPVPKPWIHAEPKVLDERKPKCIQNQRTNSTDCVQQKMWLGFYEDFARRREKVCNITVAATRKRRWAKRTIDLGTIYEPRFD